MDHAKLVFEVTNLRTDEVWKRPTLEVAVDIEAHLTITDDSVSILDEEDFEVVLLAQELDSWMARASGGGFVADLGMVLEYPGALRIDRTTAGWVVSSTLTGRSGPAHELALIRDSVRDFITDVRQQVVDAGFDPELSAGPNPSGAR